MEEDTEEYEAGAEKSTISADLIRGHINTIILRSLYDRDKYGYEIINEINEKSHGQYTLKQPTLYSALKRLENQGYIQAYWKSDEISAGGRRKYFRLTETGREITEKNQAEWEYSRTVIDSLISDKNFDFTQPAPTPIDFKILKQATSRVPAIHEDNDTHSNIEKNVRTDEFDSHADQTVIEAKTYTVADRQDTIYIEDPLQFNSNVKKQIIDSNDNLYNSVTQSKFDYSEQLLTESSPHSAEYSVDKKTTNNSSEIINEVSEIPSDRQTEETTSENQYLRDLKSANHSEQNTHKTNNQRTDSDDSYLLEQNDAKLKYNSETEKTIDIEESRRIAHENYIKLISGAEKKLPDIAPYAENTDTNKLVYNLKPEQERDYKNLIDRLFDNTLKNSETIKTPEQYGEQKNQATVSSNFYDPGDKAASDGLKVSTSEQALAAGKARQNTYNKGATLFKCSLIIGVIMLLEFTLTLLFKEELGVPYTYPVIILVIGIATVLICGILFGARYGKYVRKPLNLKYITTACVITVILIFIVFIFAIILQVNWSKISDVLAKIVVPCIVTLNIPVFTLSFYLFTK